MPDEKRNFTVGGTVWVWADPGRWQAATVVAITDAGIKVRLSKIDPPDNLEVPPNCVRHRDFARHGADRPRKKPQ